MKKIFFVVLLCVLLTCCCIDASATDIYVPDDYGTIQEAIDNAMVYDTIIVRDGTYEEKLDVHQKVTVTSENGTDSVIVKAAPGTSDIVNITNDDIIFRSITVDGFGNYTCFRIQSGYENYTIDDCNISGASHGIHTSGSYGFISNNLFNTQTTRGILINIGAESIYIQNNTFQRVNVVGIYVYKSSNITCIDNTIDGVGETDIGIRIDDSYNTIYNNTIDTTSQYGVYVTSGSVFNISANTITNSPAGIFTDNGVDDVLIEENIIDTVAVDGIRVDEGDNITIRGNVIASTGDDGIQVYYGTPTDIVIDDNIFSGVSDSCISITGSNISLNNNTITGGDEGINIIDANGANVTVSDSIIDYTRADSISVYNGDIVIITNNNIANCEQISIDLAGSTNATLSSNVLTNAQTGIKIQESSKVTIFSNVISSISDYGIYLNNGTISNVNITDNVVTNANYSSYIVGSSFVDIVNVTVNGSSYGHFIDSSTYTNVSNCVITNSTHGVHVEASSNCNVSNNNISLTTNAIYLYNADDSYIQDNHLFFSSRGVYFTTGSDTNTMRNNTVENNSVCGVVVWFSDSETIYNNYFNNTNNYIVTSGTATWNTTKTPGTNIIGGLYLGGNFWSGYNGSDTDGDGLGNTLTPYGPGDYLPLVIYTSPTAPSDIIVVAQMRTAHVSWSPSISTNTIQPLIYHWNTTNTTGVLIYNVTTNKYAGAIQNLWPGTYNFSINATDNTTFSNTTSIPFTMTNTIDMVLSQPTQTTNANYGIVGVAGLGVIPFLMKNYRDIKKYRRHKE